MNISKGSRPGVVGQSLTSQNCGLIDGLGGPALDETADSVPDPASDQWYRFLGTKHNTVKLRLINEADFMDICERAPTDGDLSSEMQRRKAEADELLSRLYDYAHEHYNALNEKTRVGLYKLSTNKLSWTELLQHIINLIVGSPQTRESSLPGKRDQLRKGKRSMETSPARKTRTTKKRSASRPTSEAAAEPTGPSSRTRSRMLKLKKNNQPRHLNESPARRETT